MQTTMQTTATEALKFAWGGEIYGMAFFQQFIDHYPQRQDIWQTLYDIELLTEAYLRQRLVSVVTFSDAERQQLVQQGIADASQWLDLPWAALCQQMRDWVEPWQEKYALWNKQAENQPQRRGWLAEFAFVDQHETAIFTFWQAASQGDEQASARLQADFHRLQQAAG